ncbi:MAG: GIY-YIG nuclease family protein [Saprospiraceae bacterium]|nr:GIY-YIG nuclease family protein [Saprospiraceae bacterium]
MSRKEFFPPRPSTNPTIYAYELVGVGTHIGLIKIGYTDRDAQKRVKEQLGTAAIQYKIAFEESAMKRDGSSSTDHDIHRHLRKQGFANPEGEWFKCSLKITRSEPGLFKRVTGLSVRDFELLVSLGVFNSALMNDAVYKFKRYEDASLEYIGINKHQGEDIGLFDTVLSREEYQATFLNEEF